MLGCEVMAFITESKIPKYLYVKISDAIVPRDGYTVMLNRWWVTKDDCLVYYRDMLHPQCNTDVRITKRLCEISGGVVKFIPIVYEPHNCYDYVG